MSIEGVQTIPMHRPADLMPGVSPPEASQPRESGGHDSDAQAVQGARSSAVIQFSPDPATGTMRIQVVNPDSGDVVRQIPPEELVAISRMLGLLFDKVA